MNERANPQIVRARVIALLEGDERLYEELCAQGLLPGDEGALSHEHLEVARLVHTLTSELEVNFAGVEVILRMRGELIAVRKQVAELVALLRDQRR